MTSSPLDEVHCKHRPDGGGCPGEVAAVEWGISEAEWGHRRDRIEQAGRADGLTIRMDTAWALDSRPAHRVLKLAVARGLAETLAWEAMFAAHLRDNLDLAEWNVLADLKTGLERDEVLALGENEDCAAEVLADHEEGQSRGIHSVPTVVHGDRLLAGARSVAELTEFVRSAAKAKSTERPSRGGRRTRSRQGGAEDELNRWTGSSGRRYGSPRP
ncbi:DsbA family protein [Amycolatopsis halotolerans]|uniref:DsbA family protein n=1 Tax=Amycolatopsis halotolerans TaxID=330083 RepID=A0ABV7QFI2_9PSEU